ncbi:MAG: hypothetical protein U0P30_17500 [Vicinamibacterales bacterium]
MSSAAHKFTTVRRRAVWSRTAAVAIAAVLAVPLTQGVAFAQAPTVQLSKTVVTPGAATIVTVTGQPGESFAILGSSKGSGFAFGGVNFSVGADFVILALSTLDGTGKAVVSVTPPFSGTELDRYYLQVATSPSPAFQPLKVSTGQVLVNADLSALAATVGQGPAGPQGPVGPAGAQGPAGPTGPTGATGAAGAVGPQGPAGPAGAIGPVGPQGPQGAPGNDGAAGAVGPQGPRDRWARWVRRGPLVRRATMARPAPLARRAPWARPVRWVRRARRVRRVRSVRWGRRGRRDPQVTTAPLARWVRRARPVRPVRLVRGGRWACRSAGTGG